MSKINVTSLDFNGIRQSLIDYFSERPEFKDYDFEGAGLSFLVGLCSANTEANAFLANMIANEMFIDSAIRRESIVSRAKAIGYTPHSVISARARINVTFDIDPSTAPSQINVPRGTKFTAKNGNDIFTFSTEFGAVAVPNADGKLSVDLVLVEGHRLIHKFVYDASAAIKQRFVVQNMGSDTTTFNVKVQQSATSTILESFTLSEDINIVDGESRVYFLSEVEGGKYEVFFGDGVLGKALTDGNIVIVEYIVSRGDESNKIKVFRPVSAIEGYANFTITTLEEATGGTAIESDESIRQLAPLFYETQNRAVTRNDYETLIKKDFPEVQFVRVWGGETNDPPVYGKVFVSIKPTGTTNLSTERKQTLINEIIRSRNLISIEVEIIEPDYLNLICDSEVTFNSRTTTLAASDIQTKVITGIKSFRDTNLIGFNSSFKYSQLVRAIDSSDAAITNNLTDIQLKYRYLPTLNIPRKLEIFLNNPVQKGDASNNISSLNSTGFLYQGSTTYVGDDGKGSLYFYRIAANQKVIFQKNVGTINYTTGKVVIDLFNVQGYVNNQAYVDFIITPEKNDITPLRNQIILIDDADIKVTVVDEK